MRPVHKPRKQPFPIGPRSHQLAARELAYDCLALLWPTSCVGCGFLDRTLCTQCAQELGQGGAGIFDIGGLSVPCFASSPYSGVAKAALVAYKHQGAFGLVRPLGRRLAEPLRLACSETTRDPPIVITMPSRAKRVRERGYRHVEELVRVAYRADSRRIDSHSGGSISLESVQRMSALRPLRGRTGQVGLDVESREENARRIAVRWLWSSDLQGRQVILVDDIVTTGATMRAAQEVLEEAGACVIAVAALCVAVRRDTREISSGNRT